MKIVQLNIWGGRLLKPIIDFLEREQPDIVCMQEVIDTKEDHSFIAEMAYSKLIDTVGFTNDYFSPTFSFQHANEQALFGNAIAANFPIIEKKELYTNGGFQEVTDWSSYEYNSRMVQAVKLQISDDRELWVVNHHGFHDRNPLGVPETMNSMRKFSEFVDSLDGEKIVCGDFNIVPEAESMKLLNPELRNHTIEAGATNTLSRLHRFENACDYILTSPSITVHDFTISDVVISDHVPLILEFDL